MHTVSSERQLITPAAGWRRALSVWFAPGEPHPARGPFARWPRITDSALAVIVFVVSLVTITASALGDDEDFTIDAIGNRPYGALALLAVAAAALLWRRWRPIAVTAFITAIMIAWAIAGYGDGQDLAMVVAVYAVGRYATNHRHGLATVAVVMAVSILDTIIDTNQRIDIVPAIVLTGLPWYVGHRIRNRGDYVALLKERAERLEADQHAEARQAVVDERSRIARELHDVVAHQVSMMTVQAGAAKTVARDDLNAAVDAMGDVERAGRQALGELRHLLGVLRQNNPDTDYNPSRSGNPSNGDRDDLGPQPGLADIPALADQLTHTGADVSLTIAPLPPGVSAAVNLSAYRIVQESLTNIIKHAGRNPTVHLSIDLDSFGLVIDITNTVDDMTSNRMTGANAAAPELPAFGYGIAGMRERATLLGGTLTAAPQPPNRFRVKARIPVETDMA